MPSKKIPAGGSGAQKTKYILVKNAKGKYLVFDVSSIPIGKLWQSYMYFTPHKYRATRYNDNSHADSAIVFFRTMSRDDSPYTREEIWE